MLTKDEPLGDVVFGVDNTFGSRAVGAGVFEPYEGEVPAGVDAYALEGDDEHVLTPVDTSSVCVNVDETWFEDRDRPPPRTLDDLTDPAYRDLLVTPSPASSSPGLAFLLATIGEYDDDWPDYWRDLLANGAKVTDRLVERLQRRLHPRRREGEAARRRLLRLEPRLHGRRTARAPRALCSTPASSRSSTPAR